MRHRAAVPAQWQRARTDRQRPAGLVRFTGTGTSYIQAGSPGQNPYVKSFGSRLRDELAVEEFNSLLEAQCWSRTGGSSATPSGPTVPLAI
jgi:hypothetical protein